MTLPVPLRGWTPYLNDIHDDLALVLVGMLEPLANAFSNLRCSFESGTGEPEGFDGLSNRGHFDLLLPSEWALAEVLPDEFLRRAANREQLFLRRELRQSKAKRLNLVLFDSGPHQLGNPRLVQLALLLVFARRTLEAGGSFAWGTLQDSHCRLWQNWDRHGIESFLAGRTLQLTTRKHLDNWVRRLTECTSDLAESWLVGLPSESAGLTGWSRIQISDLDKPGSQEVDLMVTHRQRVRNLSLTLPKPNVRTWLLRDPLKSRSGEPATAPWEGTPELLQPRVVVHAPSAKLFFQFSKQKFCILKVTTSARGKVTRVKAMGTLPAEHQLLGASLKGRDFHILTKKKRWLYLIPGRVGKHARLYLDQSIIIKDYDRTIFKERDSFFPFQMLPSSSPATPQMLVLAPNGDLFRLKKRARVHTLSLVQKHITHLKAWGNKVYFTKAQSGKEEVTLYAWHTRKQTLRQFTVSDSSNGRIFFPHHESKLSEGLVYALHLGKNRWQLEINRKSLILDLETRFTPIDMFHKAGAQYPNQSGAPERHRVYLLGLDDSRNLLYGLGHHPKLLFESEQPILSAHVCTAGRVVALFLDNGLLEIREPISFEIIYSLALKDLV